MAAALHSLLSGLFIARVVIKSTGCGHRSRVRGTIWWFPCSGFIWGICPFLSWKWIQATWMGMFESQLRQSQKSPHSLNLTKAFYEQTLGPVFSLSWKSWWRAFTRVSSLSAERWEGIAPPSPLWKAIIWGYEILSYCDHEGACCPGTPGGRWKESEFPWHCGDSWDHPPLDFRIT